MVYFPRTNWFQALFNGYFPATTTSAAAWNWSGLNITVAAGSSKGSPRRAYNTFWLSMKFQVPLFFLRIKILNLYLLRAARQARARRRVIISWNLSKQGSSAGALGTVIPLIRLISEQTLDYLWTGCEVPHIFGKRWAIIPIPIRFVVRAYRHPFVCVWEVGVALTVPFIFEAPAVQHLLPDCAIKFNSESRRGRSPGHCKLLDCPRPWPQLRHIRCAFHFVYLCSCRDAVYEKVPTHLQAYAAQQLVLLPLPLQRSGERSQFVKQLMPDGGATVAARASR